MIKWNPIINCNHNTLLTSFLSEVLLNILFTNLDRFGFNWVGCKIKINVDTGQQMQRCPWEFKKGLYSSQIFFILIFSKVSGRRHLRGGSSTLLCNSVLYFWRLRLGAAFSQFISRSAYLNFRIYTILMETDSCWISCRSIATREHWSSTLWRRICFSRRRCDITRCAFKCFA